MYKIKVSNASLGRNGKKVDGISRVGFNDDSRSMICVRQGQGLIGYDYSAVTDHWNMRWNETVFKKNGEFPIAKYPWFISDKILDNSDVVMIYHPDGIKFYQLNEKQTKLKFLVKDGNFHEVYGWKNFLFGNFYPDPDQLGVMTRNARGEIQFYAATKDSFQPNESDPLFLLNNELFLSTIWKAATTEFFSTNLMHNTTMVIGLHTTNGLEFYQFNKNYDLKKIFKTEKMQKSHENNSDRLFFADLTHQQYQDILFLNNTGLHVYKYDKNLQNYIHLHESNEFARSNGWLPKYIDSHKDCRHQS